MNFCRPWLFFTSAWNVFDFVIVVACLLPFGSSPGALRLLRLFRLFRMAKLIRAVPQLQVIIGGLIEGMSSIAVIALMLFLLMYLFGILGIILFRDNDPWHFKNLHTAMVTLFRCATLEDWSDVMYINMYGCAEYGYDHDGLEVLCVDSKGLHVVSAVYWVTYVIISSLVMLSLFIGVVTTSMQESTDKQNTEKTVLTHSAWMHAHVHTYMQMHMCK